ncbi:unnamed protein product [Polarella glacialis]|uniref:Steroid 5-alpha reductase C-terminal domain-containing protein n=1 Tax=Polarella glacialis TaxID=89957 RepID=A0A813JFK9_POLGL|nr:unnamed protein product [Polarella glacialis]
MAQPGSLFHLVKLGARVHPVECLLAYALPYALYHCNTFHALFRANAIAQLALFIPLVQIPSFLKSRMSYVDIGWPLGLVLLACLSWVLGEGYYWRKLLCCGCLLLHGGRMALGALVLFFPYQFPEDLPRYQYAKVRFEKQDGMPASLWWAKIQHDTLQQAFANSTMLAAPFLCMASNRAVGLHPLEVCGGILWLASFLFENWADAQKENFLQACAAKRKQDPSVSAAVLGMQPWNGSSFCTWTWCRHPNYFGEWMCWNAFLLMATPSLLGLEEAAWVKAGIGLTFVFVSRFFFDCLCFWTGAEPAEYFSVRKRPDYRAYQSSVRMFFPFEVPSVNHYRISGWPSSSKETLSTRVLDGH